MKLTPEQERVLQAFDSLVRGGRHRLVVGGLAGTGKSTLIAEGVRRYRGLEELAVCTPTGKAAHVQRSKGVPAMTLHSLLYHPRTRHGELIFVSHGQPLPSIVIVDEASMLSQRLVTDLERDVERVMYVGDHGQREPIGDDPGLMKAPDFKLETIHRHAGDSPIIDFAHGLRIGRTPKAYGRPGDSVCVQEGWSQDLADFDVIIVGYNRSRLRVNAWVRRRRGYEGKLPQVGETIICLRNNKDYQVWNGMTASVDRIDIDRCRMNITTDDGTRKDMRFDPRQFGRETTLPYVKPRRGVPAATLWDFGYALTCHKVQGSEFDRVAVVDEQSGAWDEKRWRYTAATRAKTELRWVFK